jgi:hypothetical protein
MRIYPDVYSRRFLWMSIDLLLVGWIAGCVLVGRFVDHLVLQLDVLAQGVIGAGRTFNSWLISLEQAIPNGVPFVSDPLRHQVELLRRHSGEPLISAGQAGSNAIHTLGLVLGIVVAAIPIVLFLLLYLPRRLGLIYDMQGIHQTVRRALQRPQLTAQTMEFLAARALFTQPYHRLLRYSSNPVEDWHARRFEPLARAELERHGLTVERYFKQLTA